MPFSKAHSTYFRAARQIERRISALSLASALRFPFSWDIGNGWNPPFKSERNGGGEVLFGTFGQWNGAKTGRYTDHFSQQRSVLGCKSSFSGHFYGLLFVTAVPNTKLCAWGEEDSGGRVLRAGSMSWVW
jgi:hypothetical protein